MYGGGFATVPAYLKDIFGTRYVGAIHGLLLTAWSMAGIFGPTRVNYILPYNVAHAVEKAQAHKYHHVCNGCAAGGWIHLQLLRHSRPCMKVSEAEGAA